MTPREKMKYVPFGLVGNKIGAQNTKNITIKYATEKLS